MLWSNPDNAWITASLEYLRTLCVTASHHHVRPIYSQTLPVIQKKNAILQKSLRSLNKLLYLPAQQPGLL